MTPLCREWTKIRQSVKLWSWNSLPGSYRGSVLGEISGMKMAGPAPETALLMRNMKWTIKKPLTQGRFWWSSHEGDGPKLVFVEKQSLGLYAFGAGWVPYQEGQWAGPMGEQRTPENN